MLHIKFNMYFSQFAPPLEVRSLIASHPSSCHLSISQSIASCVFSSLRDTQLFPGRSGSWLRLDEAIKTTADWNRLREQQCKLKGAHVVKKGVNSNRLALQNKEALTVFMGSVSLMHLQ